MNFISILGLLLLLGIAWILSYHRKEVSIRLIFWGIGLQLIFALIILREDHWSFIGMSILSLLIITFLHQKNETNLVSRKAAVMISAITIAIGFIFYQFSSYIHYFMGLSLIYMLGNGYFKWDKKSQKYASSLFLISGMAIPWESNRWCAVAKLFDHLLIRPGGLCPSIYPR